MGRSRRRDRFFVFLASDESKILPANFPSAEDWKAFCWRAPPERTRGVSTRSNIQAQGSFNHPIQTAAHDFFGCWTLKFPGCWSLRFGTSGHLHRAPHSHSRSRGAQRKGRRNGAEFAVIRCAYSLLRADGKDRSTPRFDKIDNYLRAGDLLRFQFQPNVRPSCAARMQCGARAVHEVRWQHFRMTPAWRVAFANRATVRLRIACGNAIDFAEPSMRKPS